MIPDDEAYRSGLTTNHTRRNSKYGGGYPVYVEGLHQLHCLVRLVSSPLSLSIFDWMSLVSFSFSYVHGNYI